MSVSVCWPMRAEEAERLQHKHIGTEHLLLGLLREEKCFAAEILHERGLRLSAIREELAAHAQEKTPSSQSGKRNATSSLLAEFSRDLTQSALDSMLDPLVGRDAEVDRVIQILCRRTKNNPVLIGEPGVGKTAIVEGLAQRIADGDVPSFLADKRILALDLSLIVAGTKYRGQFEERLKTIMKELMENQNAIIFIDELHTLVGAGSAEGSLDAANILKPALSPRRDSVHRRHDSRRIPQVHRKGPLARAAFPGRQSSASERRRCDQDLFRHQGQVREISCCQLHRRGDRSPRYPLPAATFPIASFLIRPST